MAITTLKLNEDPRESIKDHLKWNNNWTLNEVTRGKSYDFVSIANGKVIGHLAKFIMPKEDGDGYYDEWQVTVNEFHIDEKTMDYVPVPNFYCGYDHAGFIAELLEFRDDADLVDFLAAVDYRAGNCRKVKIARLKALEVFNDALKGKGID